MRVLKRVVLVCMCGFVMSASTATAQTISTLTAAQAKAKYLDCWKNPDPNVFFKIFLDHKIPDIVIWGMLQPSLDDCLQLFETEYAPSIHMELAKIFNDQISGFAEQNVIDDNYQNSFSKYESFKFEKESVNYLKKKYPAIQPYVDGDEVFDPQVYELHLDGYGLGAFVYNNHWMLIPMH
ncbi:MAG: hypothetical protein J6U04_04605 [Salinivirgaceae bacterium]|nr:hypothetical protein [Salinivirgaceae bacterium]